jgi:tRNA-2-methylthio-N6-dimethylallyladenosine synthase
MQSNPTVGSRGPAGETRPFEGPTAHIFTFGCQMNEADSEKMAGILRAEGYRLVDRAEEADVILLNTCSIRAKAEQKVFSLAGRLRDLKKKRPGLILVMAGCLAQRWGETLIEKKTGVDVVIGPGRISRLPALLRDARERGRPAVDVAEEWAGEHPAEAVRGGLVKAWINIMNGCDNFCAYCVVPSVRGPERSREPDLILAEAGDLGRRGYREVTLLGQNVNSYGRGLQPALSFADLLRRVEGEAGIPRLRFTTSHPKDLSRELIEAIRDLPSVCEAVHLPLQAGGDGVLGRMNRGYTYEEYRKTCLALREAVPGVAVTTDIIVGFPGETAAEYEATLGALSELEFDGIFSFRFSPREGTAAWDLEDDVPDEEKTRRLVEVQALQREIMTRKSAEAVGKTVEVLVEGPSRKDASRLTGRTRGNRIVIFPGPPEWAGRFMEVTIRSGGFLADEGVPARREPVSGDE